MPVRNGVFVYRTEKQSEALKRFKKPRPTTNEEFLSGYVQGKRARQGEERLAIALSKLGVTYYFRVNPTGIPTGYPGWAELDFLVMLEE